MHLHYTMHAPYEALGILELWAKTRKVTLHGCRLDQGEALPSPKEVSAFLSLGGP